MRSCSLRVRSIEHLHIADERPSTPGAGTEPLSSWTRWLPRRFSRISGHKGVEERVAEHLVWIIGIEGGKR